jgi:hypothetical protein
MTPIHTRFNSGKEITREKEKRVGAGKGKRKGVEM